MGVEVAVHELTKSFGKQKIWGDVTLTLPPGEVSVLLGPSGTGKSVFLKSLIGLLKPDKGSIVIRDVDVANCCERKLYETRKLFGVLFQDGALFGSMNLFDNIAFPLREHTRKGEKEIADIVNEKMEMVGLQGAEKKLPGEISGGMRKRAGLARALVLDPEIILFDEPDSGLDPVRVAYLNQLIVDLNAQTDATFLIVTHDIGTARTVPDNLGMLFRRELVMFGPREVLLTSEEPVVKQFLNGRREGPIGMSEEKDSAQVAAELASLGDRTPRPPRAPDRRARPARACRRRSSPARPARAQGRRPPPAAGAGDDAHPPEKAQEAIKKLMDEEHEIEEQARAENERRQSERPSPTKPPTARRWGRPDGFSLAGRRGAAGRAPVRALPGRVPPDLQAALPVPRVHPAGLVHRQRHDRPDRAGRDPVRRGHRAAARHLAQQIGAQSFTGSAACSRSCARRARSCAPC